LHTSINMPRTAQQMDKDAYIERMTAQQKLEQQKLESTQMKRLAVEIREVRGAEWRHHVFAAP
jgi:hypothetical protein